VIPSGSTDGKNIRATNDLFFNILLIHFDKKHGFDAIAPMPKV
jgi:hypothetical protein